jgi:glycopeptide antibiotics resistance protein
MLLNILAFMPLGLFFCAYFSSPRRAALAAVLTFLLGFAVSLGIEVLQAYIPGRVSDWRDVATDTLGTALGVFLYQTRSVPTFLAKVGLL